MPQTTSSSSSDPTCTTPDNPQHSEAEASYPRCTFSLCSQKEGWRKTGNLVCSRIEANMSPSSLELAPNQKQVVGSHKNSLADMHVPIHFNLVSRVHTVFVASEKELFLYEGKAKYGMLLDDKEVEPDRLYPLKVGSRIQLCSRCSSPEVAFEFLVETVEFEPEPLTESRCGNKAFFQYRRLPLGNCVSFSEPAHNIQTRSKNPESNDVVVSAGNHVTGHFLFSSEDELKNGDGVVEDEDGDEDDDDDKADQGDKDEAEGDEEEEEDDEEDDDEEEEEEEEDEDDDDEEEEEEGEDDDDDDDAFNDEELYSIFDGEEETEEVEHQRWFEGKSELEKQCWRQNDKPTDDIAKQQTQVTICVDDNSYEDESVHSAHHNEDESTPTQHSTIPVTVEVFPHEPCESKRETLSSDKGCPNTVNDNEENELANNSSSNIISTYYPPNEIVIIPSLANKVKDTIDTTENIPQPKSRKRCREEKEDDDLEETIEPRPKKISRIGQIFTAVAVGVVVGSVGTVTALASLSN